MTDSELRDARVAVEDRIEGGRQRDRRRGLVAAAAAAAVVVGVATWQGLSGDDASPSPAPPGPSPAALSDQEQEFLTGDALTAENLPGVWRLDNSRWLFMFTADGGFRYDETGRLSAHPRVYGTYAVDGDTITVDIEGGSAGCAGQTITLRAVVSANGPLHVLPVGSDPSSCGAPFAASGCWSRCCRPATSLSYRNVPGVNWDPPAGYDAVLGTWYDPTGRLPRRAAGRRDLLDHHGDHDADRQRHLDRRPVGHPAHPGQRGGLADVSRGGPVRPRQPAGEGLRPPQPPGRPRTQRLRRGVEGRGLGAPGSMSGERAMSPRSGTGHHVHGDRGADPSVGRRRPRR